MIVIKITYFSKNLIIFYKNVLCTIKTHVLIILFQATTHCTEFYPYFSCVACDFDVKLVCR